MGNRFGKYEWRAQQHRDARTEENFQVIVDDMAAELEVEYESSAQNMEEFYEEFREVKQKYREKIEEIREQRARIQKVQNQALEKALEEVQSGSEPDYDEILSETAENLEVETDSEAENLREFRNKIFNMAAEAQQEVI